VANILNLYDYNNNLLASLSCTDFVLNISNGIVNSVSATAIGYPVTNGIVNNYRFLDHSGNLLSSGPCSLMNQGSNLQLATLNVYTFVLLSILVTVSQQQFSAISSPYQYEEVNLMTVELDLTVGSQTIVVPIPNNFYLNNKEVGVICTQCSGYDPISSVQPTLSFGNNNDPTCIKAAVQTSKLIVSKTQEIYDVLFNGQDESPQSSLVCQIIIGATGFITLKGILYFKGILV
jgi:hypothetical protein